MIDSHSRGVCCVKKTVSSTCSRKGEDKIGCWEQRRERERERERVASLSNHREGKEKERGGVLETCHSLSSDSPKQTTKVNASYNRAGQHACLYMVNY